MAYKHRYDQSEGQYSKDKFSSPKIIFYLLLAVVFILPIFLYINTSEDTVTEEKYKVKNDMFRSLSVSELEYVVSTSKKESDREDALFILFETYRNRSVFNLYDFYLNHKGERFTDEAYAIVIHVCDSLYDAALASNTEQGWSDYLVSVPEDFQRDALDRYNDFRWEHTADKWDTEEKAWEQVGQQKGAGAYQRYIKMYPEGEHINEARTTIKQIKRDEARRERNQELDRQRYKQWIDKVNKARWK